MTVHDQISAALQRAAELAPDGRRIQAELAGRTRRYRQRRALLIGAVAAAGVGAVAATVPTILKHLTGGLPADYPMVPVPSTGPIRVKMLLRPGWLPAGLLETSRMASLGEGHPVQSRGWQVPNWTDTSPSVGLDLQPADLFPFQVTGHQTVNGHRIPIFDPHGGAVTAQVALAQGMVANVSVFGTLDDARTAARIADSLEGDEQRICEVSLRFGWLPAGMPADKMSIRVRLEPGTGALNQGVDVGPVKTPREGPTASARIGGSRSAVSFAQEGTPQPVTVRGRPGTCTYVVDTGNAIGEVVVELADGRWLAVSANGADTKITRPVLLRIAEELVVGADPAVDWER